MKLLLWSLLLQNNNYTSSEHTCTHVFTKTTLEFKLNVTLSTCCWECIVPVYQKQSPLQVILEHYLSHTSTPAVHQYSHSLAVDNIRTFLSLSSTVWISDFCEYNKIPTGSLLTWASYKGGGTENRNFSVHGGIWQRCNEQCWGHSVDVTTHDVQQIDRESSAVTKKPPTACISLIPHSNTWLAYRSTTQWKMHPSLHTTNTKSAIFEEALCRDDSE